jgi:GNAT superfamily N-acetyltransferase
MPTTKDTAMPITLDPTIDPDACLGWHAGQDFDRPADEAVAERRVTLATTDHDVAEAIDLWARHDSWVSARMSTELRDTITGFGIDRLGPQDAFAVPGGVLLGRLYRSVSGVVALRPRGTNAELTGLYVSDAARGTGLGATLLDHAIAYAWLQGFAEIELTTVPELMPAADALFRRAGFVERAWSRRLDVDVLTMVLPLDGSASATPTS